MNATNQQTKRLVSGDFGEAIRRFMVILAIGFWLGGFTFYAGVVIHTGHRVFGSARETGFLTQQVTGWLNLSGVAALSILLWNALAGSKSTLRWHKTGLWLTWGLMVVVLVALFALHPVLDGMLDADTHRILQRTRFHGWHKLYMNLATLQWGAGLLHTWLALLIWRSLDASQPQPAGAASRKKEQALSAPNAQLVAERTVN